MINSTIIHGRLVKDPELRYTKANKPVATFIIAWSKETKNMKYVLYLKCVAYEKLAEIVARNCYKGKEVNVMGELHTRTWESNGKQNSTIELSLFSLDFCGPAQNIEQQKNNENNSFGEFEEIFDEDTDLPF